MLSRVAAVLKAPRTHNRRRVTGSSGRRREGREGEPQRPNMSRRVFTSAVLLLLVVMMCCGTGGAAQTKVEESPREQSLNWNLFVWKEKENGEAVSSLRFPSLVEVDGDVFAVAEAQCTSSTKSDFTGIASELLELNDGTLTEDFDASKLNTEVLDECHVYKGICPSQNNDQTGPQSPKKVHVVRPTTVVQLSEIYMLAGNYSSKGDATCGASTDGVIRGLFLVRGHVVGLGGEKKIHLINNFVIPCSVVAEHHNSLTGLIGGGGSGIKMKDDTTVFPVEGEKEDGKTASLIIYSSDNVNWNLSKGISADGCSDPSVVEWKDKLMMMTACDDGRRRVYEIGDKGESWTEALGTLSRVWGDKHKRHERGVGSGFITATIEEREVMLVTLPVYSNKEGKEKGELHLWLTDNTHIADIGPVSGNDDAAASSLLYKSGTNKEELIALYEKKGGADKPSPGMASVRLTAQLERVKDVLATWKELDEIVAQPCPPSAARDASSANACSAAIPRDGLVGFLSGNFSGNTWKDEYLGVNAKVTGAATETSDGVTFQGAWAEWPVGSQGQNQLYRFANYNFTLVATVSIRNVPEEGNIPLMGVRLDGNGENKFLELSYDKEKKWQVRCGAGKTEKHSSGWEPGKTHQVAIVLQDSSQGSVYVNGERVGTSCELKVMHSKGISHFYIGGDGGSAGSNEAVSVTVTNVLLY
ncbi:trans-sialidase, putative, partial [Trypanosoma cruzi marinkellei]